MDDDINENVSYRTSYSIKRYNVYNGFVNQDEGNKRLTLIVTYTSEYRI